MRITRSWLQSGLALGGRLLGALEQLDRMTRHDRRDGVLVDQLRVAIPTQQYAKIVKPGHDSLQFDPVHQENGERHFAFADVVEECVLEILCSVGCHCRCSVIYRSRTPAAMLVSQVPGQAVMGHRTWGMDIRWQAPAGRKPKLIADPYKIACFRRIR